MIYLDISHFGDIVSTSTDYLYIVVAKKNQASEEISFLRIALQLLTEINNFGCLNVISPPVASSYSVAHFRHITIQSQTCLNQ